MKILKRSMCLLMVLLIMVSTVACVSDANKNIAKINGQKIKKQEFNDYYNVMTTIQEAYGYSLPETEEDINYYKEIIVKEFVRSKLIELYNKDNNLTNDVSIEDAKTELYDLIKSKYPTDAELEAYLSAKGYTLETFDTALTAFLNLNNAITTFYAKNTVGSGILEDQIALTVGDVVISKEMFNYYALNMLLNNYANENAFPGSDAELEYNFENIKSYYVAFYAAIYDYGIKNGYELTEEEINTARTRFGTNEMMFGTETMSSLYNEYFINEDNLDEFSELAAKFFAMETKLSAELMANYNPTDEELKTYYDGAADTIFGKQVSAYHILTKDLTRAEELLEESLSTPEGFMAMYEKYSSEENTDETIVEAADLGSFYHRAMVQEFSDAAFAMEIGEVKGLVETEFGYHLIYVYDTKEPLTWENDKEAIKETYLSANRSSYVYNQLDKIYDSYKVKNGNYRQVPSASLDEWLKDIYKTKIYYYNLED